MDILIAVAIVAVIGAIAAVGLVLADKFMSVPTDERAAHIEKLLPGANCGACGFSGCSGYADAIVNSGAGPSMCSVGGADVAKAIAEYLGVEADTVEKKVSVVFCRGSNECASKKMDYKGISSCKAVANQFGGTLDCRFGCIGLGDCVKACEFGGITVRDGVAVVDTKSCVACGQCVTACPKGLISLVPARKTPLVLCSSRDSGAITRKACTAGCIGCKMCEKACESDAIKVVDFRAVVDFEKCTGCGKCVAACKLGCVIDFRKNCGECN